MGGLVFYLLGFELLPLPLRLRARETQSGMGFLSLWYLTVKKNRKEGDFFVKK